MFSFIKTTKNEIKEYSSHSPIRFLPAAFVRGADGWSDKSEEERQRQRQRQIQRQIERQRQRQKKTRKVERQGRVWDS